jgi:hypothetical protein
MKNFEFDDEISEMGSPELVIEPPPKIRWQDEPDPELRKMKIKASVDRMLSLHEEQSAKLKEGAETT